MIKRKLLPQFVILIIIINIIVSLFLSPLKVNENEI